MGKENLFSTKRELTGEQMLENAINRRQIQRQNRIALAEANKLSNSTTDFTTTMEAANLEAEENARKSIALENAYYAQGSKNIVKQQLGMRSRLVQEGTEQVFNKVIGEMIYESYWLDDPVKESTAEQIAESIGNVWDYIEENCKDSKVTESKQSKFLKGVRAVIEEVVKEATDRIVQEAIETNSAFSEFELNEEEELKLDEKLCDLGKDEIISLIKDKVAHVVQDEKEKGKERSEMFTEIDQAIKAEEEGEDEEPEDEEETSTEESFIPTLEGATWESLKIAFGSLKSRGSKLLKEANKNFSAGNYDVAKKKYTEAKDIFEKVKVQLKEIEDTSGGNFASWLIDMNVGLSAILRFCDLGNTRGRTLFKPSKSDDDGDSFNTIKSTIILNMNTCIKYCNKRIGECNSSKKNITESMDIASALSLDNTDMRYTASERYISNILESGAPFNVFEDNSWNEFKSYVSLTCKKIKNILITANAPESYCAAKTLIDDLCSRLSSVPEDIPADVKEFVNAMVSMIYGVVPTGDVIISRLGGMMGSPDLATPAINVGLISWADIFVNIKTNLSSVRAYCETKCISVPMGEVGTGVVTKTTLESLIAEKKNRIMNRNIGSSLFEAMMLGNLSETAKVAMESSVKVGDDEVEDAALIETLLQYTVFETLDTLGIYKFKLNDIKGIKRDFVSGITEATTPVYGDSDKQTMSNGPDKTGKKKIRINTRKMKVKSELKKTTESILIESNFSDIKPDRKTTKQMKIEEGVISSIYPLVSKHMLRNTETVHLFFRIDGKDMLANMIFFDKKGNKSFGKDVVKDFPKVIQEIEYSVWRLFKTPILGIQRKGVGISLYPKTKEYMIVYN